MTAAQLNEWKNHKRSRNLFIRSIEAGFKPSPHNEQVRKGLWCKQCGISLEGFTSKSHPFDWHCAISPNCPFVIKCLSEFSQSTCPSPPLQAPGSNLLTLSKDCLVNETGEDKKSRCQRYKKSKQQRLHKSFQDFINGAKSMQDKPNSAAYRRRTFHSWSPQHDISAKQLADNGFIHIAEETVQCVFCDHIIAEWNPGDTPSYRHNKESPSCKFLLGLPTNSIPDLTGPIFDENLTDNQLQSSLGIITGSVVHSSMSLTSRRKDTFLTWSHSDEEHPPHVYWEAGFFWTGEDRLICCYTCGVKLKSIPKADDIWVLHAQTSPKCQLVLREKGDAFVFTVLNELGTRNADPKKNAILMSIPTRMIRPRFDTEVSQATLKLGYTKQQVKDAIVQRLKYGEPDFKSVTELVQAIRKTLDASEVLKDESDDEEILRNMPTIIESYSGSHQSDVNENGSQQAEVSGLLTICAERNGQISDQKRELARLPEEKLSKPQLIKQVHSYKSMLQCKICMDAPVGVVFLPCGHLVCCSSCASFMNDCPMCRRSLTGRILTNLNQLTVSRKEVKAVKATRAKSLPKTDKPTSGSCRIAAMKLNPQPLKAITARLDEHIISTGPTQS